jgi:Cu/Zn superoxide dismutase
MMFINTTRKLEITAIVAALAFATVSVTGLHNINVIMPAFAQQQQTFTAKLSGNNEVPPLTTTATGLAQFQLSSDGNQLSYTLNAKNLNNFMMAHIHQGKPGEMGQPVAMLSMGNGKITSADLQGPLAGKQMSDLVSIMKNGGAYVNVHTQQNQNGEIRGQILTVP